MQNLLWGIPRCNIYSTISTDLLHQIHKGIFCHVLNWFTKIVESNKDLNEFDKRFSVIPSFPGIKKFHHGILRLSQITAREWADIFKVCIILQKKSILLLFISCMMYTS
jgi:hypothetical protein